MMKRTNKKESRGLPGGPHEQFAYVTGVFQQDMYHLPKAQKGYKGVLSHRDSVEHQANKIVQYEQVRGGPGGIPLPQYSDPKYMSMLMDDIFPEVSKIMPDASAIEKGEAMDYVFNSGWNIDSKTIKRDPRAYALQEYYRKYDSSKLDKDGKWAGRRGAPYSFDAEYANTIGKLSENERRVLMNKGRDWYLRNINVKSDGSPNDNYYDTWYGRIWNTNDFSEFDPNNPNFSPRKKYGGKVPKAQLGNKGKREFIKKYKETDINRLKHYQDKNPKFRDLSVDELENFGVMDDDYGIFTSTLAQNIPLGRNRRFGIQWDDGDEYAEILKSNPLWKEIYKENKKDYKLENLINKLKKKEYSGNKDYSLTPAIIEELNYLQNLKEGDKDFFRKSDTDILENIILEEYNISGSEDPEVLKRRKKFKRSAFDFAKELSTQYIVNNEEILPFRKQGGKVSTEGYKRNSPDVGNPFNVIPSGNITMKDVDFPVKGVDNLGNEKIMYPGGEYQFPGDMVYETPIAQDGREIPIAQDGSGFFDPYSTESFTDMELAIGWQNYLNPSTIASESTRLEPITIPSNEYINSVSDFNISKRFHKDWMNSPMHMQMLKKSAGDNYLKILKQRNQNIDDATLHNRFIEGDQWIFSHDGLNRPSGGYAQGLKYYNQSPLKQSLAERNLPRFRQDNQYYSNLPTHELSHITDYNKSITGFYFGDDKYDSQFTNFPKSDLNFIRNLKIKDNKLSKKQEEYYSDPTEVRARLNEIRHSGMRNKTWDSFNEKMTPKELYHLNFDISKPRALKDLQQIYTDEQIIDLLNTISQTEGDSNISIAQEGMQVESENDPRYQSYQDSLNLYNAMVMQDRLMGDEGKKSDYNSAWSIKDLKKRRKKEPFIIRGRHILDDFGQPMYIGQDFQDKYGQFGPNLDEFNTYSSRPQDLELINYYESLGFTKDDIMFHSSPDLVSDKIKAIGSYFDGTAESPVFPKPTSPVSVKGKNPLSVLENTKDYLDASTPQPSYRIYDYMKMEGMDPSPESRDMWAKMLGMKNYKRTAEDNKELIKKLKEYKKNPIRAQEGMQLPTKDQITNDPELMNWDNYNTLITKKEQKEFNKWIKEANIHPWDRGAYDVQGYWKEQVKGKGFDSVDEQGHRPDRYKKPNHPTFSDLSMYWKEGSTGFWEGPEYWAPSTHAELYGDEYYEWMRDGNLKDGRDESLAGYMLPEVTVMPKKQQGGEKTSSAKSRKSRFIELIKPLPSDDLPKAQKGFNFSDIYKKQQEEGFNSLSPNEMQFYRENYKTTVPNQFTLDNDNILHTSIPTVHVTAPHYKGPGEDITREGVMDTMGSAGKSLSEILWEFTGIPAAGRIAEDPVKTAKGVKDAFGAAVSLPGGITRGIYNKMNTGDFDMGLTKFGKPYSQGLSEAGDALAVLPWIGAGARAFSRGVKALSKTPTPIIPKNVTPAVPPAATPSQPITGNLDELSLGTLKEAKPNANRFENITEVNPLSQDQARNLVQQKKSSEVFNSFTEGANTIDDFKINYLKDLTSAKGVERLINQEADYLRRIGIPEHQIAKRAEINAFARINEIKDIGNLNRKFAAGRHDLNDLITNKMNFNNAYYGKPSYPQIMNDVLFPKPLKKSGIDLFKSPDVTRIGSKAVPGKTALGTMYSKSKPVASHEIGGHGLQAGRKLPVDDRLKKLEVDVNILNDYEKKSYKYFMEGKNASKPSLEPSAFLHEFREAMLEAGLIKSRYEYISPEKIKAAKVYFDRRPSGIVNKTENIFASNTRIVDFIKPTKSNFELLARELNQLPVITGAAATGTIGAKGLLNQQEEEYAKGGELDKYQGKGEYDIQNKDFRNDVISPIEVTPESSDAYKYLDKNKQFLTDWYSSDMAKSMLAESYEKQYKDTPLQDTDYIKKNAEENLKTRIQNLNAVNKITAGENMPSHEKGFVYVTPGEKLSRQPNRFRYNKNYQFLPNVGSFLYDTSNKLRSAVHDPNSLDIFKSRQAIDLANYLNKEAWKYMNVTNTPLRPSNRLRHNMAKEPYLNMINYGESYKDGVPFVEYVNDYGTNWKQTTGSFYDLFSKPEYKKKRSEQPELFNTIFYNPQFDEKILDNTILHELGHISTDANTLIPNEDIRTIQKEIPYTGAGFFTPERMKMLVRPGFKDAYGNRNLKVRQKPLFQSLPFDYHGNPTEVQTRLNIARFHGKNFGWDAMKRKATKKDVEQLKKSNNHNIQELFKNYSEEHILEMLNSVAYQNNDEYLNTVQQGGSTDKKWMQKASKSMEKRGTKGSLTRTAKAAGYSSPKAYCESRGWKGKKCGFLKGVLSSQGKMQAGGQVQDKFEVYKNYINGTCKECENEAVKVYDKLNRIYYKDAKQVNMSPPNYIMTHIIGNA